MTRSITGLPFVVRRQRGLSIVELMVGITIGLFILAGASLVLTTQLGDNRRLLLEAQVQQDLRAASDLISREIRAAGYWGNAYLQVWTPNMVNPYSVTPLAATAGNTSLVYFRSLDEDPVGGIENNVINDKEYGGFRLNASSGALDMQLGNGNWQQLTDPAVLSVEQFSLAVNNVSRPVPCGSDCPNPTDFLLQHCARDVVMTIVVQAVHDPAVRRSISNRIRLRNDVVMAACT
jgi:type II secretory pathway pseudopilin PulG